jgi:hypothetical protein
VGEGGEMTQILYAHMNNNNNKKIMLIFSLRNWQQEDFSGLKNK